MRDSMRPRLGEQQSVAKVVFTEAKNFECFTDDGQRCRSNSLEQCNGPAALKRRHDLKSQKIVGFRASNVPGWPVDGSLTITTTHLILV